LQVIDSMTLADFQQLGANPGRMPIPFPGSFDQKFCDGFMDALIERWFEVDPAGAFASIEELEKKLIIKPGQRWAGSGRFSAAVARSHRETLLEALPANATWPRSDRDIPAAFTSLAARDPAAARRFLERITDPECRKSAEIAIAEGIAKSDPLAALALARTLGSTAVFNAAVAEAERIGPGMLRQVLAANDRKFPIGFSLTELVLRHPHEDWNAFVGDAAVAPSGLTDRVQREARRLSAEERQQMLSRLDQYPSAVRESLASALVDAWALAEPRQASEWAFAHAANAGKDAPEFAPLAWAFHHWMSSDEEGVLAWWAALPASQQRDRLAVDIAAKLANDGRLDRALKFFHPDEGSASADIAVVIASAQARNDPAGAAAWLDSLPAKLETDKAIGPIVQTWIGRDAAAAARWVEAQPAGTRRDAALNAYTLAATELDPAAAGEWAASIADPASRTQAAEFVFRELNRRDPPAARAFLRSLPNADKAWVEALISGGR
jgi:hypothetical protein